MPASPSVTQNGQTEDQRIAMALALLDQANAKQAEKDAKKAQRQAERQAPGYVAPPNAPHVFLRKYVDAVNAANQAYDGNDAEFRAYIMRMLVFVDTAARGDNLTTARDFEVMGNLIENSRPAIPTP